MSHFRRSNFGRFQSNTATESYQHQLTAPVNKWKRQWVSPTGLAPESSYKICKWVKIKEKAKLAGATSEIGDGDDVTPALDGDDDEEGEGEGENDDGMDEDEGEGEGDEDEDIGDEGEGEGEGDTVDKVPTAGGKAEVSTSGRLTTKGEEGETIKPSADGPSSTTEPNTVSAAAGEGNAATASAPVPTAERTASYPTTVAAAPAASSTQNETEAETHEATIPPHVAIPSNVVEVTNVPPNITEDGSGSGISGAHEESVRIESRTAEEDAQAPLPNQTEDHVQDEKMDVDEPVAQVTETNQTDIQTEAAEAAQDTAGETALEKDEGLVMGEMEPPAEQAELKVDGGDLPPAEVEQ